MNPPPRGHCYIHPATIVAFVAWRYGVHAEDVTGPSRKRSCMEPRRVASMMMRRYTCHGLVEIGQELGGRDHTTVIYHLRSGDKLLEEDPVYRDMFALLESELVEFAGAQPRPEELEATND